MEKMKLQIKKMKFDGKRWWTKMKKMKIKWKNDNENDNENENEKMKK